MNVIVLLASGLGLRFNPNLAKQFFKLAGASVLEWSIQAALCSPYSDEVVVSVRDVQSLSEHVSCSLIKRIHICIGGETRHQSSHLAIRYVCKHFPQCEKILLHDAVRPFLEPELIRQSFASLDHHDAVGVCTPAISTIALSQDGQNLLRIPDRRSYWYSQTPQAFKIQKALAAYEQTAHVDENLFSDNVGVFRHAFPQQSIGMVHGLHENLKITEPSDIHLAENLLIPRRHCYWPPQPFKQRNLLLLQQPMSQKPSRLLQQLKQQAEQQHATCHLLHESNHTAAHDAAQTLDALAQNHSPDWIVVHHLHEASTPAPKLKLSLDSLFKWKQQLERWLETLADDGMVLWVFESVQATHSHAVYHQAALHGVVQSFVAELAAKAPLGKRINALCLPHSQQAAESQTVTLCLDLLVLRCNGQCWTHDWSHDRTLAHTRACTLGALESS